MSGTERTKQGEQFILPGAERSARQAALSRESANRGMMRSTKPQQEPGGLFAPPAPAEPERLL